MADTVTVKSHFGQLGVIDKQDLTQALQHGFSLANNDEIKDHNDSIEYGQGLLNPAITFLESGFDTATLGASRELENATGLTTPEAQAARAHQNPIARLAGVPAGLVADPFGAIGLLGKGAKAAVDATKIGKAAEGTSQIAKILAQPAAAAMGSGIEGVGLALGQSVSEHALGDPELNAEKVAANLGYGALIGGGLGGALEGVANRFGKSTLSDAVKIKSFQTDIADGLAQKQALEVPPDLAEAANVPQGPQLFEQFPNGPQSLADVHSMVGKSSAVMPEGLPAYSELQGINERLPDLEFKPHNLQLESLKDQGARDYYKTILESNTEDGQALRDYEGAQKAEAKQKLTGTIEDLSPGQKPISDPVKAGEGLVGKLTDQYEAEKKELSPFFKKFDELAKDNHVDVIDTVGEILHKNFPDMAQFITTDAKGALRLDKYEGTMPISREAHSALKEIVNAANKEGLSISGLRSLRENIRNRIVPLMNGQVEGQLKQISKSLMDAMQSAVQKLEPDMAVRESFKKWAQNEERRGLIESVLGGKIGDKASILKQIKPEDVLDRVFRDTNTVKAFKELLGGDFNKTAADYLSGKMQSVTDQAKNGFSSNKFASFLDKKSPELTEALRENADKLQRMRDLTDFQRILPDAPSVNPSGTAKSINILERVGFLQRSLDPRHAIQDYLTKQLEKGKDLHQKFTLDEVLAGKDFKAGERAAEERYVAASRLAKVERMASQATENIKANAKAIFKAGVGTVKAQGAQIGGALFGRHKLQTAELQSDDRFAQIIELQNNPEAMMNKLQASTNALFQHAPEISQALQVTQARATEFLASKIPALPPSNTFSGKPKVPKGELLKFERYYKAVYSPLDVLGQVKLGTITPESTETLKTVFPKLYQEMSMAVLEEAQSYIAKKDKKALPFKTKMAVSMFLGQDLDQSLDQKTIMANQLQLKALTSQAMGPMAQPPLKQAGLAKLDQSSQAMMPAQKGALRLNT